MGLSTNAVAALHFMQDYGLFSENANICDFGSQEVDSRRIELNGSYEALYKKRNHLIPESLYDSETGRIYGSAKDFFETLGCSYSSFDIDGRWGSYTTDLNEEDVADNLCNSFDISFNLGTSEHIFNQYNYFKQHHKVTKPGGYMVHMLPFHRCINHGFFSYSTCLFFSLAKYNDYEVIGAWYTGKPGQYYFRSIDSDPSERRCNILVILKKNSDQKFKMPLQVNAPMIVNEEKEERYGGEFVPKRVQWSKFDNQFPQTFWVDPSSGELSTNIANLYQSKNIIINRELKLEETKEKLPSSKTLLKRYNSVYEEKLKLEQKVKSLKAKLKKKEEAFINMNYLKNKFVGKKPATKM
jgi:hypothetical protein